MAIFVGRGTTKSHFLNIFKCQYLVEIFRYGSNFYRFQNNFYQHKVSRCSFIDFQGMALSALPRVFDPQSDLGFKRVNSSLRYFLNQDFRDFLNRGLRISCTLQQLHFATHALCKPCTLQHVYFAHYNVHSTISIEPNTNQLDGLHLFFFIRNLFIRKLG